VIKKMVLAAAVGVGIHSFLRSEKGQELLIRAGERIERVRAERMVEVQAVVDGLPDHLRKVAEKVLTDLNICTDPNCDGNCGGDADSAKGATAQSPAPGERGGDAQSASPS
jgi:hypothetical protein